VPIPRAAATLGLEFIDADVRKRTIELAFSPTEDFNPTGNVRGGFVATMLYDTVGPALLAALEPDQCQSTLAMSVNFLAAATARSGDREGACRRVIALNQARFVAICPRTVDLVERRSTTSGEGKLHSRHQVRPSGEKP
jgi:acyl-coenzyme A thioesterase PaaI-like protein